MASNDFHFIPAPFTPMKESGELNLEGIERLGEFFVRQRIQSVFINGTTGEGLSLSTEERMQTAEKWLGSFRGKLRIIVHVGHSSSVEARRLVLHAGEQGADAIAAVPPFYYPNPSHDGLARFFQELTAEVPNLPFYFYYIPSVTGAISDFPGLMLALSRCLPNLAGIKFSHSNLFELSGARDQVGGDLKLLFGVDEMLCNALPSRIDGAVGSTYNYMVRPFQKIVEAYSRGSLDEARDWQIRANRVIRAVHRHGGMPAMKHAMKFLDLDCGPLRAPLSDLDDRQQAEFKRDLDAADFFELLEVEGP